MSNIFLFFFLLLCAVMFSFSFFFLFSGFIPRQFSSSFKYSDSRIVSSRTDVSSQMESCLKSSVFICLLIRLLIFSFGIAVRLSSAARSIFTYTIYRTYMFNNKFVCSYGLSLIAKCNIFYAVKIGL